MKDVNKIILVGRIGADPVRRETKNGLTVVQFPLATSRWMKETDKQDGMEAGASERTQWHRVVTWGKQAEACSDFLKKGDSVYVEGAVRTHKYETKEGDPRMSFEVHAETVSFLGKFGGRKKAEAEVSAEVGARAEAVGE